MVSEVRSRSKYLRSLLGKRSTTAEDLGNGDSDVSVTKKTNREYYELQEVAAVPQNAGISKAYMGSGTKNGGV